MNVQRDEGAEDGEGQGRKGEPTNKQTIKRTPRASQKHTAAER